MAKTKKKGLSSTKKGNIAKNKLGKSGQIKKEKSKEKRKEKRALQRKEQHEAQKKKILKMEGKSYDNGLIDEDYLEMINKDDLEHMMDLHGERTGVTDFPEPETLSDLEDDEDDIEKEDQQVIPKGSRLKKLLPIRDDTGWKKQELVVADKLGNAPTLIDYKRKGKDGEEQDSGIDTETPEEEEERIKKEEEDQQEWDFEFKRVHDFEEKKKKLASLTSVAEIMAYRKRELHEKKVSIGCLAMNVIEDPTKLENLKFLLYMLHEEDVTIAVTIKKYVSLSLLNVFHSIFPSYKIQDQNIKENQMKKETYLVAKGELQLLGFYRTYLKAMERFLSEMKENPHDLGIRTVGVTALKCMGDLVVQHPHFNYTSNILQTIVPYLNHTLDEARQCVLESLKQVLKQDKIGHLTVDIVKRIYKLVKFYHYRVKPEILQCFLHIRVTDMKNPDFEVTTSRKNIVEITHKDKLVKKLMRQALTKPSKAQRKDRKKAAKLREEKTEVEARELATVVNKKHTDILSTVFTVYFYILKYKARSKLISLVLEGLARFAHLINIEFFNDLLKLLSDLLDSESLSQLESLHCIKTVFTILFGQGEALTIDPHKFYKHFYKRTFDLSFGKEQSEVLLYLNIAHQILMGQRKKIAQTKVLAFTKRLETLILCLTHQEAIPVLNFLRSLLITFTCNEALLEPSEDGSLGIFDPSVDDPEHSHPAATALWGLHHMTRSYHPTIQDLSKNILGGTTFKDGSPLVYLTKRSSKELYRDFDLHSLKFKPPITHPDAHIKAHQNFVASKKRKRGQHANEFGFDNVHLQMRCENVDEEIEKYSEMTLNTFPSNVGGKYHKKQKLKSSVVEAEKMDLLNIYDSLIQNQ